MSQIIIDLDDQFASQVYAYTSANQTTFESMTKKLWLNFLNNNVNGDTSITDEQEQILEQRYQSVINGNANFIDHDNMIKRLKNRVNQHG